MVRANIRALEVVNQDVREDVLQDVVDAQVIVREAVCIQTLVSQLINHKHRMVEARIVVTIVLVDAKIVVVQAVEKHVQMIVPPPVKMLAERDVVVPVPAPVAEDAKVHVQDHVVPLAKTSVLEGAKRVVQQHVVTPVPHPQEECLDMT